jgi:Zn ribbon nucleic-acid-binding protein
MRDCPQCGIRQYAQMSYVAPVECVGCGFRLVPAKALPSSRWQALSSRHIGDATSSEDPPTATSGD